MLSWLMSEQSPHPGLTDARINRVVSDLSLANQIHDRSTMHYEVHLVELTRHKI